MKNIITTVNGVSGVVHDDPWSMPGEDESDNRDFQIVSLERLLALAESGERLQGQYGVMLHPDDDPDILLPWLASLRLIALQFPRFSDGRAYSQAYLLRARYGFEGELRAVGDVLRDQLAAMRHCGFSSFAIREDRSAEEALKGLEVFDLIYARSVSTPQPLFRRR
ncbi:Uncharacterized conserved protein, DUF934 family [Amphritea atlantica]|uniref:Uncharacterized conserved protein, DUF934 family n=1 Tax=Amphritea atlantica TaxID=355243 RepID=A0A1H9J0T1_9GAMM|nr:DUF934 domain-containing protein [Amphritea atlantica]SEQ80661.1 Uncharacterized conserved protein, DUF934 family [Amphritea atlantica]